MRRIFTELEGRKGGGGFRRLSGMGRLRRPVPKCIDFDWYKVH